MVEIAALLFTSHVTLGKQLHVSQLRNGDHGSFKADVWM
jgi:hypothetical protein